MIWNLIGRKIVERAANWISPPETTEQLIDRKVYFMTLYDNLDPEQLDNATLLETIAAIKAAKDEIRVPSHVTSKGLAPNSLSATTGTESGAILTPLYGPGSSTLNVIDTPVVEKPFSISSVLGHSDNSSPAKWSSVNVGVANL